MKKCSEIGAVATPAEYRGRGIAGALVEDEIIWAWGYKLELLAKPGRGKEKKGRVLVGMSKNVRTGKAAEDLSTMRTCRGGCLDGESFQHIRN